MTKANKAPAKPPHPSRLSALDLAILNCANAQVVATRLELKCKVLETKVRELEYIDARRVMRDQAHALEAGQAHAEAQYREVAERLSKDYAVDLKTAAIVPETGEITRTTLEG